MCRGSVHSNTDDNTVLKPCLKVKVKSVEAECSRKFFHLLIDCTIEHNSLEWDWQKSIG